MVRTKLLSVWLMVGSTLNLFNPCLGMAEQANAQTGVIAAAQQTITPAQLADVSLDADNQLCGTVVSPQSVAVSGANIQVFQGSNFIAAAKTDDQGSFKTGPLAGGRYQLVTANQTIDLRVWTRDAAPPNARQQLVFADGTIVRGQCNYPSCAIENCDGSCGGGGYGGGPLGMFSHPILIGTVIAAAIAIPIALNNDDDDAS